MCWWRFIQWKSTSSLVTYPTVFQYEQLIFNIWSSNSHVAEESSHLGCHTVLDVYWTFLLITVPPSSESSSPRLHELLYPKDGEMSETTHPVTWCHVPEDLHLLLINWQHDLTIYCKAVGYRCQPKEGQKCVKGYMAFKLQVSLFLYTANCLTSRRRVHLGSQQCLS